MKRLTIRQVGVRHVASDGTNDVGEIDEAHLRCYAASLPGSYTVPGGFTAAGVRPGGLSAGGDRVTFANAVDIRKKRLLSSDPELSQLEAHRLASSQIANEQPGLLAAYRRDAKAI